MHLSSKFVVDFDTELADQFVKFVSVFPSRHIVELSTGDVGIIVKSDNKFRLKPKTLVILSAKKQPRKEAPK